MGSMEPLKCGIDGTPECGISAPLSPCCPSCAQPGLSRPCRSAPLPLLGLSGVAARAVALRKALTAELTRLCAHSGSLCPSPGAASGARGQPALQAKQRKVRVSCRELCPRLKKHILAEERNTIQAGRETRLLSNPLQEAFGSLQLLESLLPVTGLFIFTGFHVFVFCLLDQCCRGDRAEQNRSSGTGGYSPAQGDRQPSFPFLPVTISLCGLGALSLPSLPWLLCDEVVPPNTALCLFTIFVLVKCL